MSDTTQEDSELEIIEIDDTVMDEIPCVLEQSKRLSQSIIWEMQENFFERRGVKAWQEGIVPHYITSNAFVAAAYATMVFGFLRDCRHGYDPDQPLYIVELGCGHGRFAYHFLKIFRDLHRRSALKDIPFKYVMSDSSQADVEFWQSHESLKPFLDEGILDFSHFDPQREAELKLVYGCERLSPGSVANPMIIIANYFFDSIPMDAFHIKDGRLYESRIKITTPEEEPDPTDPEILGRMTVSFEQEQAQNDYYDDPVWNRILSDYKERLADTALLFPTGALECIQNLNRISNGRMMILSADRGECREDALQGYREIKIAVHGSFSLRVNYHAIGKYIESQNGIAFQPRQNPSSLVVSAFLMGDHPGGYAETGQAYREAVEEFGPDDFFNLKNGIQGTNGDFSLDQLLAFLKMSRWDTKIFNTCFPGLMRSAEDCSKEQRHQIHEAVMRVWDMYYHLGESADLPFNIGTLLCQIRYFREALKFFDHSIRLNGHAPGTNYNMALCYMDLREMDKAAACVNKALELDADFEPARELRIELESLAEKSGMIKDIEI